MLSASSSLIGHRKQEPKLGIWRHGTHLSCSLIGRLCTECFLRWQDTGRSLDYRIYVTSTLLLILVLLLLVAICRKELCPHHIASCVSVCLNFTCFLSNHIIFAFTKCGTSIWCMQEMSVLRPICMYVWNVLERVSTKINIIFFKRWHGAGTYDCQSKTGGPLGTIRNGEELSHKANAGLAIAVNLLQPIKDKYPELTYADFYQVWNLWFAGLLL